MQTLSNLNNFAKMYRPTINTHDLFFMYFYFYFYLLCLFAYFLISICGVTRSKPGQARYQGFGAFILAWIEK